MKIPDYRMIKIVLISFVWKYVKLIALFWVFVLALINKESNDIIEQKTFKIDGRYTNFSIRPIIINTVPDTIPIGKLLYYGYYNSVFNLTYNKIIYKSKYFWLKEMTIKKVIKSIFFWYIGISRLSLLLILKIVKYKEESITDYLLKIFGNPIDDRLIIKINNKWEVNGNEKKMWNSISSVLENRVSTYKIEYIKPRIFSLYHQMKEINFYNKTYAAKFVNIKNKTPHKAFFDSSKDKEEIGYETEYKKAYINGFYNKYKLINWYDGEKKESTLLNIRIDELKQISKEKKILISKQLIGAIDHGFGEKISTNYTNKIKTIEEAKNEIEKALLDIGIIDEKTTKTIIKDLVIYSEAELMVNYSEKDHDII